MLKTFSTIVIGQIVLYSVNVLMAQEFADTSMVTRAKQYVVEKEYDRVIDLYKKKYKEKKCTSDEYKVYAVARLKKYQSLVITRRLIDRLMGDNLRHAGRALQAALKANSADIEAMFFYGIYCYIERSSEKAILTFESVLARDRNYKTYAYDDVKTELSRLYVKKGDYTAVKRLYETDLNLNPDDAWSKIQLAIAYGGIGDEIRMNQLYFEGLHSIKDKDQLERLFKEFRTLASPAEIDTWESLDSLPAKKNFIRTFWKKRDPNIFEQNNQALVQFYQRLVFARSEYYKNSEPGYDDRGAIYIRFGKPDRVFYGSADYNTRENESWIYDNLENGMHFDFVLFNTVYELRPLGDAAIMLSSNGAGKNLSELFKERQNLHPFYAETLMRLQTRRLNGMGLEGDFRYRNDTEKTIEHSRKQYFAYYDSAAPIYINARTAFFREDQVRSRLDFYYMIPYRQMQFLQNGDDTRKGTRIDMTMKILDYETYEEKVVLDHKDSIWADSSERKSFVYVDEFRHSLSPGRYLVALQVRNNGREKVNRFQYDLEFRDFSLDTIQISDIQLALTADLYMQPSRFIKPHSQIKVVPNPSARWTNDQSLSVYYEIYNLTLNNENETSYEVSYSIKMLNFEKSIFGVIADIFRSKKKDPSVVSVTTKSGLSRTEREYISFDISELPPGEAVLEIKVRDLLASKESRANVTFRIGKAQIPDKPN